MHIKLFIYLLLAISISACIPKQNEQPNASVKEETSKMEVKNEGEKELLIYDSFDDMEYIFNYDNDTTYVINFWATWCKPCVEELPYFDDLYNEYKTDKLRIILVSLDFPKQIETKLKPFIKKNNVLPEVMVLKDGDVNTWIDKVSKKWDGAIPVTIIYNRNERVFVSGEVANYEELNSKVKPLISI